MSKGDHPEKREALKEYKRLYIVYLESHDVDKAREDLRLHEVHILADSDFGITEKTLSKARDEALIKRRDQRLRTAV